MDARGIGWERTGGWSPADKAALAIQTERIIARTLEVLKADLGCVLNDKTRTVATKLLSRAVTVALEEFVEDLTRQV